VDGTTGYLVTPKFFEIYGLDGLNGTFFFSETCLFYGGPEYCTTSSPDRSMADALLNAGAPAVIGYYDSVLAIYSRDMMKTTLEGLFEGRTAGDAFSAAKKLHGKNDGNYEEDGVPASPILSGDTSAAMTAQSASPAEQGPSLQQIEEEIVLSLAQQLYTVTPYLAPDGLYYIPYTNTTPYTFSIEVTVDYYLYDVFIYSASQVLTFEPGETMNVPFEFAFECTTGRLTYRLFDIYDGDRKVK